MQGDSSRTVLRRRHPVPLLVGAHVVAASVTVLVLSQVGRVVAELVPLAGRHAAVVLGAALAASVDLRAVVRGELTWGVHRQTPKALAHDPDRPWWVTPLIWGVDTGMIWTTFRVSSASWLLLASATLGLAPWWAGAVYGSAFALPLAITVFWGGGAPIGQARARLAAWSTRLVQVGGIALLVLPVGLVVGA